MSFINCILAWLACYKDKNEKDNRPYILYTASEKLTETQTPGSIGLSVNSFGSNLVEHTFENGVGKLYFDGPIDIGNYAFYKCNKLFSILLPDNNTIRNIGNNAFNGCSRLQTINIPKGVVQIGTSAFESCYKLETIDVPDTVTDIGVKAFSYCEVLDNIKISNNLNIINSCCFYTCKNLKTMNSDIPGIINIPSLVRVLDGECFCQIAQNGSTTIPIHSNINTIRNGALSYINGVTSWNIPNTVTTIENAAFALCINVTELIIPSSITTINRLVFRDYFSLLRVIIPEGITIIESDAFGTKNSLGRKTSINYIELPSTLESINYDAFSDTDDNPTIVCKAINPPNLDNGSSFTFVRPCTIYVPDESVESYKSSYYWKYYSSLVLDENTYYIYPISEKP